jgi:PAS domain S-box-containing protein
MTDLTGEQEAASKIEEQAALLEIARDAILVRDLDGSIVFWNRSAELLYGWSRAEALGKSVETLLYRDPTAFRTAAETVLSLGEWSGEIEQIRRDGRSVVVAGRSSLIRDSEGRPHRILAINTDITERKRLEAQFLRAQRMESIGTLASGIAHDLNNVLAPILMSIELLKMDISDPDTLDTVSTIEASAIRGAAMVKQVLAFARGMDGERIPVSVARVVKDIRSIVGDALPKSISIESAIPDDLWLIRGDPTQIHQVLLNLALNARDAMPEGGTLSILTENVWIDEHFASMERALRAGPHVLIEVTDTGIGIPTEAIDRIFEPFFTTKELGRGTGLGLSTVQAIVRSHDGCTLAFSEEGKGSTFRVYLPADSSTVEGGKVALPPPELHRGNGELILVADDEAAIRSITQQTLEAFGYRVLTAEDGTAAVAVYAQHRGEIALVLTDIMMPNLDGLAAIPALQRMNPTVKIIAATGLRGQGLIEQAREAGVLDILEKPFSADRLLSAIHAALTAG